MATREALELIPALHRATHSVSVYLERNTSLHVTQAEAHILSHLWAAGEATIGELHQAFGHKRSTLTSILDRLAERGLVHREVSASDRRSFVVRLSSPGRKFAQQSYQVLKKLEAALASQLTPAEISGFLATTGAISGHAQSNRTPKRASE